MSRFGKDEAALSDKKKPASVSRRANSNPWRRKWRRQFHYA
jgi:hypothetical protein